MAETFFGIDRVLDYRQVGSFNNPCLAVDLAMLGVGDKNKCHQALVASGVSTPDGVSEIPGKGVELDINGNKVTIDPTKLFFDLRKLESDSRSQFDKAEAAIVAVKLHEDDPEDYSMHLILLGGHYREGDRVTKVVIGDSLLDGVQEQRPEELESRLERTLDFNGALLSCHVRVDYSSDAPTTP